MADASPSALVFLSAEMTARTFLCRESLWQQFEDFAREQGAPIDEVLSDAMRSYARQRSYGTDDDPRGQGSHDYAAENAPDLARTNAIQQMPPQRGGSNRMPPLPAPPPASRGMGGALPPPPARNADPRQPRQATMQMNNPNAIPAPPPRQRPLNAPPASLRGGGGIPAPPPRMQYAPPEPEPQPWQAPAPQQQHRSTNASTSRGPARLSLTYNGRHVDVQKERFILGRSKAQADLVLEDPNVSRAHSAIELQGNEWMLVDLGSTNGCYVDGQRVTTRPIQDGDVIEITTHQIQCTLR